MAFHLKHRPDTLDRILGQDAAVRTLRKFVDSDPKEFPTAILLVGPPSAGKTTLARAFAREILKENFDANYEETNFGTHRSIEDIRGLSRLANMRPMSGGRRFIMCDEAHSILGNAPATDALLKPLEEPIPSTTWILATMEPEKFGASVKGRAIRSRCIPISLNAPTEDSLRKYSLRITKAEGIEITKEQRSKVVEASTTFREVANILESVTSADDLEEALKNISVDDSPEIRKVMRGLLSGLLGKYKSSVAQLASVSNGVSLIQAAGYLAWSLTVLDATAGNGAKGVYISATHKYIYNKLLDTYGDEERMNVIGRFNDEVLQLKISSGAFAVNEVQAICAMMYRFSKTS